MTWAAELILFQNDIRNWNDLHNTRTKTAVQVKDLCPSFDQSWPNGNCKDTHSYIKAAS